MTWNGTLPAGLVNSGLILGRSAIKVQSCAVQGADFSVVVTGYDGHSYRLQYSDDLGQGAWMSGGVPERGNGALLALTRTNGVAARWTFYRVVVN